MALRAKVCSEIREFRLCVFTEKLKREIFPHPRCANTGHIGTITDALSKYGALFVPKLDPPRKKLIGPVFCSLISYFV